MMRSTIESKNNGLKEINDNKEKEFKDKNNFSKGMLKSGQKSLQNLPKNHINNINLNLNLIKQNHQKIKAWLTKIMIREITINLG
jgi:hypothetical protein